MSLIKFQSNLVGTGVLTLLSPDTNTDRTLIIPDATTTLVGTDATQTLTNKTLTSATLTSPTLTTPNINSAQVATVSGTAPLYMCRAWVNFNGTGTPAIRGSGNVTDITDNGTGDYTVNFTTAMPDANYGFYIGSKQDQAGVGGLAFPTNGTPTSATDGAPGMTTTRIRLRFTNADPALRDQEVACVSIFR